MCVKWGKVNSAYFNVSNGVRQDGILSTKLFAIYVDDLSHELIGCEPAGLTVHPPPRMIEGGFIFFAWVSSATKIFS